MPVPVPEVVTASEPEVPLLLPEAVPEHATDAEVAPAVVQLKVEPAPVATLVGENEALDTEGAATTDRLAEPVAAPPAELYAVTVQVPVPVPEVDTAIEPDVPEPVPVARPEQDTDAELAPEVVQLKVEPLPLVTVLGENEAVATEAAATPVPDKLIVLEPPPLWPTVTAPLRAPEALGVNDTLTVHEPLTASAAPQLFEAPKSDAPEDTVTDETVSGALPLLVMVTFCTPLVLPTVRLPKARLPAEKLALPWMPVAEKLADLVPASVETLTLPLRVVTAVGLNRTTRPHEAPAARVVPQPFEARPKSAPETVGVPTAIATPPVLVRVAVAVDEEPTRVSPNDGADSVAL